MELLPGRTDNAIKNHWKKYAEPNRSEKEFTKLSDNADIDLTKGSGDSSSRGNMSSCKSLERADPRVTENKSSEGVNPIENKRGNDPNLMENGSSNYVVLIEKRHYKDESLLEPGPILCQGKTQIGPEYPIPQVKLAADSSVNCSFHPEANIQTVPRPIAKFGAFSVYRPSAPGSVFPKTAPTQRPIIQAPNPDFGSSHEPVIPLHCGHGCCMPCREGASQTSIMGPEFSDYEELPPLSSQEFAAVANDLNNAAWIRSGLNDRGAAQNKASGERGLHGSTIYYEGHQWMGMMIGTASPQIFVPTFTFPTEVQGLS